MDGSNIFIFIACNLILSMFTFPDTQNERLAHSSYIKDREKGHVMRYYKKEIEPYTTLALQ